MQFGKSLVLVFHEEDEGCTEASYSSSLRLAEVLI